MTISQKIKTALISAYQKEPAIELARQLESLGVNIFASSGTARALETAGIPVVKLDSITGFEKLLEGRVKTLHPTVYAAILAKRHSKSDMSELDDLRIKPFDLVAVDLYPFPEYVEDGEDLPVELIDIGGVGLIRAAAKNFQSVLVMCKPDQYLSVLVQVRDLGGSSLEMRKRMAKEAFEHTADYDRRIAQSFK